MKRMLWSLGLVVGTSLAAQAQVPSNSARPAALLGAPRASLGLPQPSRGAADPILPVGHSISGEPTLPMPPLLPGDVPPPMPNAPEPILAKPEARTVPAPTTIVSAEQPLFVQQDNTPPFLRGERFRLSAEYLMWWTKGYQTSPLLTSGTVPADRTLAGVLGQPGTTVLFGNQPTSPTFRAGARFGFEYWCKKNPCWGLDGHYFFLNQTGNSFTFASDGSTLIARPFVNVNDGVNSAEIVAFPGLIAGAANITTSTNVWGNDINLRRKLWTGCNSYLDGLIGYRFVNLTEDLTITEQSARLVPDPAAAIQSGSAFDRFRTSNQFYGGQIGTALGCTKGRWNFDLRSTIALGTTASTVTIDGGQTAVLTNGSVVSSQGGLLALNSNIGRYYQGKFAIVPEMTFNIGYDVSSHCRLFLGYNVLYWSSVLRPADQIDTGLDINRIPNFARSPNAVNVPRPTVPFVERDFFAQGLNFGFMLHW